LFPNGNKSRLRFWHSTAHDRRSIQADSTGRDNSQELFAPANSVEIELGHPCPRKNMNEEPPAIQPTTGDMTTSASRQLTVNEAADAIGVDSFTMLSFIQRGRVNPTRSPSGEATGPESEVTKLTVRGR